MDFQCSRQIPSCNKLREQFDNYLKILRQANKDVEEGVQISQILNKILVKLNCICNQYEECSSSATAKVVNGQDFIESIDDLLNFYNELGSHDTSLFYNRNSVYHALKSRIYRICCVCGIRAPIAEKSDNLKDAIPFKELLVVEDGELAEWKALKTDNDDELGALA